MSRPESVAGSVSTPSHAPRPPAPKTRSMSPSNISLFLSNVRLLNLDQKQDWPDITVRTFDTKDALQNQKKRVSCVEWSLYRLFEIWDRETTRDKLQPFFPPLEPIQSLNLRAALFRCLNDLKKNDVLGREATLRKTMLDDCKGDKFEEVLLLFSSAVVRKQVLSMRRKQHFSIGKSLAIAKNLDKRELNMFGPLALVYRASLTKTLQSRVSFDHTLNDLRTSLYEKTNEYHQRHLTLLETQDKTKENLSPDAEKSIRRELRQNWVGSIEGCDALLAGAKSVSSDAYMDSSFEDLWQHFQQGTTPQVSSDRTSLLETLQSRVAEQNDRLRLWRAYRDVFAESNQPANTAQAPAASSSSDPTAALHGLDIFYKHKTIRVDQASSVHEDSHMVKSGVDYDRVVQDMTQGLSDVREKKRNQNNNPSSQAASTPYDLMRRTNTMPRQVPIPVFLAGSKEPQQDLFSPLKRPLLASVNSTPINTRGELRKPHPFMPRTHSQPMTTPQSTRIENSPAIDQSMTIAYGSALRQPVFAEDSPSIQKQQERRFETYTTRKQSDIEPTPRHEVIPLSTADVTPKVLEHHPSPSTDPTSLEERTNQIDLTETRSQPSPLELPESSPPQPSSPPSPTIQQQTPQERPSLSERARISMAPLPNSENNPPPLFTSTSTYTDTAPTSSRRSSLTNRTLTSLTTASQNVPLQRRKTTKEHPYPQFSTPIKSNETSRDTRNTTPRSKLFDRDAEYASVFKSRPKIAVSPVLSPDLSPGLDLSVDVEGEAEEFSFEDGDGNGYKDGLVGLESSPLRKFGV